MGLSPFQVRVLTLIRERVPAAREFALAGGGALISHNVVQRPTEDLDLFTDEPRDLPLAVEQLREAATAAGLTVEVVRSGSSFTRLRVNDPAAEGTTLVDLAWDARMHPPEQGEYGPVLSVRELAADKVLALFGRAEPRDLVDVKALIDRLGEAAVLRAAAEKDRGFDVYVLAQMLVVAEQRPDADFPVTGEGLVDLREWSMAWRNRLVEGLLP